MRRILYQILLIRDNRPLLACAGEFLKARDDGTVHYGSAIVSIPSASKDSLISFGESLAEAQEWPEVLWIIDVLKDDSDPPFPNDLHDRMVRGEKATDSLHPLGVASIG